uniref:F-box protein AT5G49610-like beta-propeller domain-containing protein n=1 Tax=Aegilops tauschii TaxID=37682 RepID=M8AZZ9_AEGTA
MCVLAKENTYKSMQNIEDQMWDRKANQPMVECGKRRSCRRRGAYGDFVNLKMIYWLSLSKVLIGAGRSDPDLAAAVRGSDFFLTRLPEGSGAATRGWKLQSFHGGYVVLVKDTTHQIAAYNPVTQALHLLPRPPEEILFSDSLEAHIVFSEEDQRVFRMVCVQHQSTRRRAPACVAVFSTATREWQVFPWVETSPPPPPHDFIKFYPGTQLNGFVYWKHTSRPYVLVLNTATVQFSRVDLPPFLGQISSTRFRLGQTKDGMLCMVAIDLSDAERGTLHVWFRRADDDGVEKWVLGDTFLLTTFIDATKDDPTVHIEAVIDGFVYLSTKYDEHTESLLSLCLETAKLNKLFGDSTYVSPAHPYIMAWPPSLVCNKMQSKLQWQVFLSCMAHVPDWTQIRLPRGNVPDEPTRTLVPLSGGVCENLA